MLKKLLSSRASRVVVHKNAHFINSCSHQQACSKYRVNLQHHYLSLLFFSTFLQANKFNIYSGDSWKHYQHLKNPYVDSNVWVEDFNATTYANELLDSKYNELDASVHCYALNTYLQADDNKSRALFTRKHSRALWEEVYTRFKNEPNTHVVVTGNPGIGKSRSMAYLLKILLEDGQLVVYEARKDKNVFIFVPIATQVDEKRNKEIPVYKVWRSSFSDFKAEDCAALKNPNNYYLIDPNLPAPIASVVAHTVIAASPNRMHYHEWKKRGNTPVLCMPSWSKDELLAIRTIMGNLSVDEVFQRIYKFGGIPRFIYATDDDFGVYLSELDDALNSLTDEKLYKLMKQGGNVEGSDAASSKDSSMLFAYALVEKENEPPKFLRAPGNYFIQFASAYVHQLIIERFWGTLMNLLDPYNKHFARGSPSMEFYFESLAFGFLCMGGEFEVLDLQTNEKKIVTLERAVNWKQCTSHEEFIASCLTLSKEPNTRTVIKPIANQPVVDFADAPNRLYQATIAKEHNIKGRHLLQYYKASPSNPIDFYVVVPRNTMWTRQRFENCSAGEAQLLDQCVKQYVLFIPLQISQEQAVQLQQYQNEALFAKTY